MRKYNFGRAARARGGAGTATRTTGSRDGARGARDECARWRCRWHWRRAAIAQLNVAGSIRGRTAAWTVAGRQLGVLADIVHASGVPAAERNTASRHSDGQGRGPADRSAGPNADTDTHLHADSDADANVDADADSNVDAHTNIDADTDINAYADVNTDADADGDAYSDAHYYADVYAGPDAYAHARSAVRFSAGRPARVSTG